MIQCEQCFVWQHGICVGLMREEDSPEHYYCEKCKPENHAALLRFVSLLRVATSVVHSPSHVFLLCLVQGQKVRALLQQRTSYPYYSISSSLIVCFYVFGLN